MAWGTEADLQRLLASGQAHIVGERTVPQSHTLATRQHGRAQNTEKPPSHDYANKLEAAYAQLLETQRVIGDIAHWWYAPFSLRLARKTFYRPDFLVQPLEGLLEIHETKGHWEDDSRVKIKVAAEKYPCFRFIALQRKKGVWIREYF